MNTVLKYHKAIIAALAILVPGSDTMVNMLQNSGIDWSVVVAAVASSNPKIWALAGVIVAATYLQNKAHGQSTDDLRQLVADLKAKVEENNAGTGT